MGFPPELCHQRDCFRSRRENPLLVREGVTSKQVMAELVAMIEATGLLPTKLKNGGGMINVTPQRLENQSG